MAITRPDRVKFIYQNLNGVFYEVNIVFATGAGVARKHGLTIKSGPMFNATETAIAVDPAALASWQSRTLPYRIHGNVYTGFSTLNDTLNAAS